MRTKNVEYDFKTESKITQSVNTSELETLNEHILGDLFKMSETKILDEDYFNKTISSPEQYKEKYQLVRKQAPEEAFNMMVEATRKFPRNIELATRAIEISSELEKNDMANEYIDKLLLDIDALDEHAYKTILNHLLKRSDNNEKIIRAILDHLKKSVNYSEYSAYYESQLESALGNNERAISVLDEYIRNNYNGQVCASRLLSLLVASGEYERAQVIGEYFCLVSCRLESSLSYGTQLYENVLIEEAVLRKRIYENQTVKVEQVNKIISKFELLLKIPGLEYLLKDEIIERKIGLEMLKMDLDSIIIAG